jgi:hypothetical protein
MHWSSTSETAHPDKIGAFMRSPLSAHHDVALHLEEAERFVAASKLHRAAFHLGLARELVGFETAEANRILPALDRPRIGSSATRQYYWRMYDRCVRKAATQNRCGVDAATFRRRGYALGALSRDLAIRLHEAIMAAPIVQYSSAERLHGFVASNYDGKSDATVNGHTQFRTLDSTSQALLSRALLEMRDDVASCLESPWRVVAVKSWTTPPGEPPVAMYGWHGDDWVSELFKIMIYLTPMTRENGGLEIFLDGKVTFLESPDPGKWVLFHNSDLLHRGVPGTALVRAVIEVSLSRALKFDLRLRVPGLNAHWPELPWVDALEETPKTNPQNFSTASSRTSLSATKQILVRLVNRFGNNRRLFKLRRRVERLKRLYFASHPQ